MAPDRTPVPPDPSRALQLAVKRAGDIVGACILLVLLSPLLLAVALAVRLTSTGPALFRQARLGLHQRVFTCYKFRTMLVNAPDLRNPDGSTFNSADDPRVTRIGRFLRKTSLDELPQLLNILKGEMSLVGPRPDVVDALSLYTPRHFQRLDMRPGVTGWAAVHGRNSVPLERRRELDIEYVEQFSLWLDLRILAMTAATVLFARGVYTPAAQESKEPNA